MHSFKIVTITVQSRMVYFFQGSLDDQGELLFFCPEEREGCFREMQEEVGKREKVQHRLREESGHQEVAG